MNTIIKKTIMILLVIIFAVCIMQIPVYADDEWISQAEEFSKGSVQKPTIQIKTDNIHSTANTISGVLLGIAIVVAVLTTAILGVSFIIQSAEGKAKIKDSLVPLIVGMIISFGAYAIWKFAINIFGMI